VLLDYHPPGPLRSISPGSLHRGPVTVKQGIEWHAVGGHRVSWSVNRVGSMVAFSVPTLSTVSSPSFTAIQGT
jgi:hypothetical protein